MRSATPKHLHPLLGRRLVDWVVEAARAARRRAARRGHLAAERRRLRRRRRRGPGRAARHRRRARGRARALDGLRRRPSRPLRRRPAAEPELLAELLATHRSEDAAATILSFRPADPREYGRILRAATARSARSSKLATRPPTSSRSTRSTPGSTSSPQSRVWPALDRLDRSNAQGELYLTDAVAHLVADGERVVAHLARRSRRDRGREHPRRVRRGSGRAARPHQRGAHARRRDDRRSASTWIEAGVELEPDSTIHPFTVLRGKTKVAAGAEIGPHAVAVDAEIGPGATVGPFCYLRPGTVLEAEAKAGTFVEIKNSRIGEGAKVPHLSYIGDADVGEGTNIGAGHHRQLPPRARPAEVPDEIGRNVRTGIDNSFVAPVEIGDNAWVAAGSSSRRRPAGSARRRPSQAGQQRGI